VTRRTLIILLIVSGGLNLFLAGIIAASVFAYWNRPDIGSGPRTAFRLYRAVDDLAEPQRSRARALLKEKRRMYLCTMNFRWRFVTRLFISGEALSENIIRILGWNGMNQLRIIRVGRLFMTLWQGSTDN